MKQHHSSGTPVAVATALVAALSASAFAQEVPQAATFARYQPMMERSPFAVATAAAPLPAAPSFAKELFVANAARLEDESVVTLNSGTDKNIKEYLSTKGPNENGYTIDNIEWSDRVGATRVTISKDGQTATLTFNQAFLTQPIGSVPAVPGVQQIPQQVQQNLNPGATAPGANNQGLIAPAPIPTLPTPPPRTRGVIQRNPVVPQQPVQQVLPQQPQVVEAETE
jgi:hypothetical protein